MTTWPLSSMLFIPAHKLDWVRNVRARPALQVRIGRESFIPEQRFLTEDERFDVAAEFRRRHPWRLRLLTLIFGWGDLRSDAGLRAFIRTRPFVPLRPAATNLRVTVVTPKRRLLPLFGDEAGRR